MNSGARWLVVSLTAAGVAGPAWAERAATQRIDEVVGECGRGACEHSIDFDFGGLSIHGLSMQTAKLGGQAELVRIEPRLDGIHVHVEGLVARVEIPRAGSSLGTASDDAQPAPAVRRLSNPLQGIPVYLDTRGSVTVEGPAGLGLVVLDPSADVSARGDFRAQLSGELLREHTVLATAKQVVIEGPALAASTWSVTATVQLGTAELVPVQGHLNRQGAVLRAAAGGGTIEAELEWGKAEHALIRAHSMGLGVLPPLPGLPEQVAVDLAQARFDGAIELDRTPTGARARLHEVAIAGLVVDAAALSKDPLYMQDLGFDGQLMFDADGVAGALTMTHGAAVSILSGRIDRDGVDLGLVLEPLPCQTLLESMPTGFLPLLEGMQLRGDIEASAEVKFSFEDLDRGRHVNSDADEERPPPGELKTEFPFLEHCEVVRDAPGIDLEALDGNYRHRFLTAGGTERMQILAAGVDGFTTIASAPDVARAFVILEDSRFWQHDGFDREQIERAFWHNLGVQGFSRGASTITQQTARNLWLGHERSLGRKFQEALLTARLEQELDKRRILEIYMNIIELGPEIHGVADAARYHFDRAPHELNTMEALYLASLAPAPVTYSHRFASGDVGREWRQHLEDQVERLRVHRLVSRSGAEQAKRLPLRLRKHAG